MISPSSACRGVFLLCHRSTPTNDGSVRYWGRTGRRRAGDAVGGGGVVDASPPPAAFAIPSTAPKGHQP